MTTDEKKELRMKLLKELYDYNEETGGNEKQIPRNVPMKEEDKDVILAYEYLEGKGLISFKLFHKTAYVAKISAYGIDHVEEMLNKRW